MLTGGASCGPKGAMAPLDLQILHVMNSDFDTVHYCSKRVGPLILLKLEIKLRHYICSSGDGSEWGSFSPVAI